MCEVDTPEVYSNNGRGSEESKHWLQNNKIINVGDQSQGQEWRGSTNPARYNTFLHEIAKSFFKEKKHDRALFIPYRATINEQYFKPEQKSGEISLPIDYFYRILIKETKKTEKTEKRYESEWCPDIDKTLDIWNATEKCLKTVLYGFLENLDQSENKIKFDVRKSNGEDIEIFYQEIKLHQTPYIYWLGIPKEIGKLLPPQDENNL